jgi:hypothetical protein
MSVYMCLLQDCNRERRERNSKGIHVEKMVKLFKMHWCAMDFDTNFCKAVFIKEEDA